MFLCFFGNISSVLTGLLALILGRQEQWKKNELSFLDTFVLKNYSSEKFSN